LIEDEQGNPIDLVIQVVDISEIKRERRRTQNIYKIH
jgi:hypothetical protein